MPQAQMPASAGRLVVRSKSGASCVQQDPITGVGYLIDGIDAISVITPERACLFMKIEEYDCVKIKRDAQVRIFEETKDLTSAQIVTHYQRLEENMRRKQVELRARGGSAEPPLVRE